MVSHKYKLTFFNGRGRAEIIRLLFAYGGVEYEDNRITKEEWVQLKAKMPFNHVPVLEVDGVVIAESLAIARYVAKELNLTGKDNLEAAVCDMVMDSYNEIVFSAGKYIREHTDAEMEKMKQKFLTEVLPSFMDNFERLIKKTSGKYLLGDNISWADIGLFFVISELLSRDAVNIDRHLALKELVAAVGEQPTIKDWVAKRPNTTF